MTVVVAPTEKFRAIDSNRWALAAYHGGGDWIVPPDEDIYATADPSQTNGPHNAAQYNSNASSGLTARINTFEAFVGGHYCASDDATITETDPNHGDTRNVHDAHLDANTANQTVYLGVDHQRGDRVIIDTAAEFFSEADPRVAIYDFTTDADSITEVTDRRPTGRRIATRNDAYDAKSPWPDAETRTVKESVFAQEVGSADRLANVAAENYARTDQDEEFERWLGILGYRLDYAGVAGRSDEVQRFAGASGDLLTVIQQGQGRVAVAWNAYWDNESSPPVWRSILSGEAHSLWAFQGSHPGVGTDTGSVTQAAAPPNAAADAAVNWTRMDWTERGTLVIRGEEVENPSGDEHVLHVAGTPCKIRIEDVGDTTWDLGEDVDTPLQTESFGNHFALINQDTGVGFTIDNNTGEFVARGPNGGTQTIASF